MLRNFTPITSFDNTAKKSVATQKVFSPKELPQRLSPDGPETVKAVVIFDFDDTLCVHPAPGLAVVNGVNKTREILYELENDPKIKLCIATSRSKRGAEMAQNWLKAQELESVFDCIVYDNHNPDYKREMINAIMEYYGPRHFYFLDDRIENQRSFNELTNNQPDSTTEDSCLICYDSRDITVFPKILNTIYRAESSSPHDNLEETKLPTNRLFQPQTEENQQAHEPTASVQQEEEVTPAACMTP